MKNLFKNLMLVAVAAMAFTACTETNDEVNAVSKTTRYEFTANIADDTRSGFAEKEEGATAYKSEWHGNETLKLFVNDNNGYYVETTAQVNAEGQFTLELENAPESFFMTVCSPAESWKSEYTCNIPAEQTPLANSVDPKAHVLSSPASYIQTGSEAITMSPQNACYGKMTVNAPDFEIKKVEVSFNGGKVYTLNATNVKNNVFWFAIDSMVDVSTFTVTAYDAENNAITKTVDVAAAGKTLKFQWGRVSTFSVSGLEEYVAPEPEPEPEGPVFTNAYVYDYGYGHTDYYLIFEDTVLGELVLNAYYLTNDDWTISTGVYGFGGSQGYFYYGMYSTYNEIELYGGSVEVEVVDGKYVFTFSNLKNSDGGIVLENATYTGIPDGLQIPDARTPLATPSVTATAEGNIITLSWDAVTGAESYYVFCASSSSISPITTTETTVTIEAAYSTAYEFMVTAKADDSDPDYKSSEAKTIKVSTEKDPNKFADVVATDIQWNTSGYFTLTVPGFSYFYLEVNSANRPNNNSLVVGDYTYGKNENQFRIRYNNGSLYSWDDHNTNLTTMNVSFVDGQYVILINVSSLYSGFVGTIGYKGMPEGWVAPTGGESGGDEPDPDQPGQGGGNELGSESNPYTFASVAVNGFFLNFEGAENGASLQLDRHSSDVNKMSDFGKPFTLNTSTIIYSGSGNVYNVGGNTYYYASFAPYSTLEVTKADGNWTCKLKMSVDAGATYTYYTYTGQIANQAY